MIISHQISLWLLISFCLFSSCLWAQEDKGANRIPENVDLSQSDVKVFDNESDFAYFIADQLDLNSKVLAQFLQFQDHLKDSIFESLSQNKQVVIPRKFLYYFLEYNIPAPESQQRMSKRIDVLPKDKVEKLSFDLKKGDHFFLEFLLTKGKGLGAQVEVLFNEVRIRQSITLNKKEGFTFDFLASEDGKVEVILRNFGFFRMEGDLEAHVIGAKEKISFQQIKKTITSSQEQARTIQDTLFKTVLDEELVLSHRKNIKESNTFQKLLEFDEEQKILGFAFYLYPLEEKENLTFHRQVTYREDPLEDFAIKELKKQSFTYLQEFDFSDLDLFFSDSYSQNFWHNSRLTKEGPRTIGLNSKKNYSFFRLQEAITPYFLEFKASNRSMLYNQSLGVKIVLLHVKEFIVVEEVVVEESEEYVLINLI